MDRRLTFGAYALPSYHAETDPPQGEFMRRLLDLLASAETLGFDNTIRSLSPNRSPCST